MSTERGRDVPSSSGRSQGPPRGAAERAGDRAARNTILRAGGEIIGKLASLVLFAAISRALGESGVGVFVLALAFVQIATMPIELGLDRFLLRRIASERTRTSELYSVLALKFLLAVPVVLVSFLVVNLLGYSEATRAAVYVLTPGLFFDSLARTVYSTSFALEHGEVPAASLATRGLAAAGLGLLALAAGLGVVTVAATYTVAAGIALLLALALLHRTAGMPPLALGRAVWRTLLTGSLPYATADAFGVLMARLDIVLLSLMASQAAVGRYGAAYRLLEATFFISWAINSSFAAMFTYLERDSEPSVQSVFQRSVKLVVALLVPAAVIMGLLAEPLARLVFGADLVGAAGPLRYLAAAVPLIGVLYVSTSVIVSRSNPKIMVAVTAGMVALNVVLNVLLIPPFADDGAAAAMLATEAIAVPVVLWIGARTVGGIRWTHMLAGPLAGGVAMGAAVQALASLPGAAVVAGLACYTLVLVLVERLIDPVDLRFVQAMVSRRLPARLAR